MPHPLALEVDGPLETSIATSGVAFRELFWLAIGLLIKLGFLSLAIEPPIIIIGQLMALLSLKIDGKEGKF